MKNNELQNLIQPIEILTIFERETADRCYTATELASETGKACSTVRGLLREYIKNGKLKKTKVKSSVTQEVYSVYYLQKNEKEILQLLGGAK